MTLSLQDLMNYTRMGEMTNKQRLMLLVNSQGN